MSKEYFVYILASKKNGTLYIGVTNDINSPLEAIKREKYLKGKSRIFKINLIESNNPNWNDLSI